MGSQDTIRNLLVAMAIFMTIMWVAPKLLPPTQQPSTAGSGEIQPGGLPVDSGVTPAWPGSDSQVGGTGVLPSPDKSGDASADVATMFAA